MPNLKTLKSIDRKYSERIYKLGLHNPLIEKTFDLVTILYGIIPFIIAGLILTRSIPVTVEVFVAIIVINFTVIENLIKPLIGRTRPSYKEHKISGYSFPSTHAATSTMLFLHIVFTPALYAITPLAVIILLFIYLSILVGRVLYGNHYIADVIAGVILGIILVLPFLIVL